MTVADDILDELRQQSGLTEIDLAVRIFGRKNAYQQRVNSACRKLRNEGQIVRDGNGGISDLYRYRLNIRRRRG
jgi:hypothetical protein